MGDPVDAGSNADDQWLFGTSCLSFRFLLSGQLGFAFSVFLVLVSFCLAEEVDNFVSRLSCLQLFNQVRVDQEAAQLSQSLQVGVVRTGWGSDHEEEVDWLLV